MPKYPDDAHPTTTAGDGLLPNGVRLRPPPTLNVVDHVAEELRNAIVEGQLRPGDRLIERKLANELHVSHIPVREAFSRLIEEGLLERVPRRGCRVSPLSMRELEEIATVRTLLEQLVVELAQQRMTDQDRAELRALVATMDEAAHAEDIRRVLELDRSLHETLWRISDHQLLVDMSALLRVRISRFLGAATFALQREVIEEHARSHAALIEAILSGNPEEGKRAMAEHIAIASQRARDALLEQKPDLDR